MLADVVLVLGGIGVKCVYTFATWYGDIARHGGHGMVVVDDSGDHLIGVLTKFPPRRQPLWAHERRSWCDASEHQ